MSAVCPSCGNQDFDVAKQCKCGYFADETFIAKTRETKKIVSKEIKNKELNNLVKPKSNKPAEDTVIKEVDAWAFTFSHGDNSITLSTPALKSFGLKFTLEDLEELLEIIYRLTGKQKTLRKLQLSVNELPDLIEVVHRLIEEKKSKVSLKFNSDELQKIAELINMKLKE